VTCAACALLAIRTLAAASDFASCFCGLGALATVRQLVSDHGLNRKLIRLDTKDIVGKLDLTCNGSIQIIDIYFCIFFAPPSPD